MLFLKTAQHKPLISNILISPLRPTDTKKVSKESTIVENTELWIRSF